MATVRCDLCDGFGHTHQGVRGTKNSTKKCPVRKILLRRIGKNKRNRTVLNGLLERVKRHGQWAQYGKTGQVVGNGGMQGGRLLGGYDSIAWLRTVLEQFSMYCINNQIQLTAQNPGPTRRQVSEFLT